MRSLAFLLTALVITELSHALAEDADFAPKIYATRADGSPAWELATLKDYPYAYSPELSPDGTRVALDGWKEGENGSDAHILVVNLNDGSVEDLGRGAMPNWSADGTWIAYSNYAPNHGVYVRQVQGGMEELIEAGGWGIQWSPDGKRLAYARGGNLIIYDLATKTKHAVFPVNKPLPYQQIYWNCGWSPDSRRVCLKGDRRVPAVGQGNFRAFMRQVEIAVVAVDGEPQLKFCCDAGDVAEDVAWHPDGTRIVIPKAGQLYVLNPDTDDPPSLVPGLPADRTNAGMCWSRDGEILVFMSYRPRPQAARLILDAF
jgi:Tol biopolymer transport system component